MNLALLANNIGPLWVAIEFTTPVTVLMVGLYRTHAALEAAWKFHPGQPRHRPGAVRHHPGVPGGAASDRAGLPAMAWTDCSRDRRFRSGAAQSGVHIPAARLWHQGRSGTAACLAAGRARRGSDADLGGAVRLLLNVALYAVLRFKMLMSANPSARWRRGR